MGYRAKRNSPLRASLSESEQQTLVLQGIRVILLDRLVALVSNRPLALAYLRSSIPDPFSWALVPDRA
jgi:hypothetical protein